MEDLQAQIDDISQRLDDNDNSLQEFSDNLDQTIYDLQDVNNDFEQRLSQVEESSGQLLFPLSQDTIDLLDEETNNFLGVYGNMYIYNLGTGTKVVTISAVDTFYEINSGVTQGICRGFVFQNASELVCPVKGTYKVTWSLTVETAGTNSDWEGTIMKNGVADTSLSGHNASRGASTASPASGTGIIQLDVGDVVSMAVLNRALNNITINHLHCTISRLGY